MTYPKYTIVGKLAVVQAQNVPAKFFDDGHVAFGVGLDYLVAVTHPRVKMQAWPIPGASFNKRKCALSRDRWVTIPATYVEPETNDCGEICL